MAAPRLTSLGAGVDGGEDLVELRGRVDEAVVGGQLAVHERAIHRHLKRAGGRRRGGAGDLGRGVLSFDCILNLFTA